MILNDGEIASLIAALDQSDKPAIRHAVDTLLACAEESPELRQILNQRLIEDGHRNYWPVAYILGHLPQPSNATLTSLLTALDHAEPDIRWAVALLLVHSAKANSSVVDLLLELTTDGTSNQKRMALYCIRDLDLRDPASRAALLAGLNDNDPSVRVASAICLKERPDLDEPAKQRLLQIYSSDADPRVRNALAIALAGLGNPSAEFLKKLKEASESDNHQAKKAADAALDLLKKTKSASGGSQGDR
ncbi:MAG TPA: HEAT repeat domain-containing protein [Terriglobales bacterium]|jgi:HEAT repeat protein|nr:HEAT repeat domain-containing protein [Terriglobales bacterium]